VLRATDYAALEVFTGATPVLFGRGPLVIGTSRQQQPKRHDQNRFRSRSAFGIFS
jgi:hypothetical protein